MQKKSNIYTILANTAVFIFLEIAALNMLSSSSSVQNFFITRNLQGLAGRFWGISESVSRYFSLPKENKELADDIFELNRKISKMTRALEIAKLDSLARIDMELASDKFKFMPATVVKNSLNKQHNYLIIGKGSDDGVRPQSGIITADGVVGIIDAVSRHYSYAISFLNSELSISARIGNDGAAGPMVWDGKHIDGASLLLPLVVFQIFNFLDVGIGYNRDVSQCREILEKFDFHFVCRTVHDAGVSGYAERNIRRKY